MNAEKDVFNWKSLKRAANNQCWFFMEALYKLYKIRYGVHVS